MSALNNTFQEINSAISGVDNFFEFNTNWVNSQNLLYLDYSNNRIGINNTSPQESLDLVGNIKFDGYFKQTVRDPSPPQIFNFPNDGDWGFYKDTNFENLYLCYNNTGELIYNTFSNESFDKLTLTFEEIDNVLTGINSLTPTFPEIDAVLVGVNNWTVPLPIFNSEMAELTGLYSTYQEIDYAASGIDTLSVSFDEIDSGINFTVDLNYNSSQTNNALGLALTSLQSGDNISLLNNDAGYLTSATSSPVDSVNGQTGAVVLDSDDIEDSGSAHKFVSQSEIDKLDFITVTGAVDLNAIEDANGDMLASTYDTGNVSADAFNMDNMIEGTTSKILTTGERSKLAGIAANAEVNVNADWDAVGGDAEILNKPAFGDITGSDIADFATSTQGSLADSALQPLDNVSELTNDAGYITSADTFGFEYRAETGDYTVAATDYTIDCISGDQTITLPTAVGIQGQIFVVKNSSTGVITITGTSSQTFDGYDSLETDFPQSLTLQSTNTNWIII